MNSKIIDHTVLVPGIYVSRTEKVGSGFVTIIDIRTKRPNFEDCMSPAASHTIEHIGRHFFKNDERIKDMFVYFAPLGCLTGFSLIVSGNIESASKEFYDIVSVIHDMFECVKDWRGAVPDAEAKTCGNWKLNNLLEAQIICANMLVMMDDFGALEYSYPNPENSPYLTDESIMNLKKYRNLVLPELTFDYNTPDFSSDEDDVEKVQSKVISEFCSMHIDDLNRMVRKELGISEPVVEPEIEDSSSLNPISFDEIKKKSKYVELKSASLF